MALYNFEGDCDNISERQLEFIIKVILEQDLDVKKVVLSKVGQAGDNFVANIKRIKVEGENGSISMIAKIAASNDILRKTSNTEMMFGNEHIMYTEVLPKLVQLQRAADVPQEEHLRYAKCYGSLSEAPHEIILLEDLNESNYNILNKFESLSDECVKSILKNFAVLHSLSYALKHKEPQTYDFFIGKLIDAWAVIAGVPEFKVHMQYFESDLMLLFDDTAHKDIIKNKVTAIPEQSIKLAKQENNNKHAVLIQGDAWTNNVMFKFEGDKAHSIMIDYQASRNSSPTADILYMIFNCTDHESRSKNFYSWLDYYHSELDTHLSNFGLKANFVYPRDQLDADLKRYGKNVFSLCLLLSNVLMRDTKEVGVVMEAMENVNMEEAMESLKLENLKSESAERVKNRIIGLIESFTEFGLL